MPPVRGRFELEYAHPDEPGWAAAFDNGVTYDGVNALLDTVFRFGRKSVQWYLGLISDNAFSALSPLDTYHVHRGWLDYPYWDAGQLTRPVWQAGEAAGGVMACAANAGGSITLGGRVRGAYLTNVGPFGPSNAAAVLWSTGVMPAGRTVAARGVIKLRYTVRIGG